MTRIVDIFGDSRLVRNTIEKISQNPTDSRTDESA